MSEDVPLSAFGGDADETADAGEDDTTDAVDEAEVDAGDEAEVDAGDDIESHDEANDEQSAEAETPADPEPPTLTYATSPDGAPCAACGETVAKRWHAGEGGVSAAGDGPVDDPDALVCPDCKEW